MDMRNTKQESHQHELISVVIPVFNRSSLVTTALEGVAEQTHRPIEIVVIDDGSTDDTLKVVNDWIEDNYVLHNMSSQVITQPNRGANSARNRGIEAAKGDFIAFLDSDDSWFANKLSEQINLFADSARLGGVYCGLRNVDIGTGITERDLPRDYPQGNLLREMLIHDVTSPTSCWLVKKICFEQVGYFDVSLPARQDWDMWIRLAEKFDIGAVPEVLVEMGNHSGERVRSDGNREIKAHKKIFIKYVAFREKQPFWVSLASRSAMYRRRGRVYFHRNMSTPKAVLMELLAIVVWPFNFDSYAALVGIAIPKNGRKTIRLIWNGVFGKTKIAIKTH